MNFDEKYAYAQKKLEPFENYIEVEKFRNFLLLVLNLESSGPEAILKQMGMGGKGKSVLPYDPKVKMYYAKIMAGLSLQNQLTVYYKAEEKINKNFINKSDSEIFNENLTKYESKNLLPNKFIMVIPEVIDYSQLILQKENQPKPFTAGIESLYTSLEEFIATQELKFVFLLEGQGEEPDVVFTMDSSFEPNHNSKDQIQYFDVYIDEERKLRGHNFIKMLNEEMTISFVEEIKEMGHSETFNSHFTIIVPVKSFDKPK